jgi:predicted house-cleaning noncanonical NTP pyrophosphatase (MazG superfamily)
MVRFQLNKLVRDKFIAVYSALGEKPIYRYLGPEEHTRQLIRKVAEEASELSIAPPQKLAEEIADIEQVLDDLKTVLNIQKSDILSIKQTKKKDKGGFRKGLYIETLQLNDEDPWVQYYRKEPKRFPEL